MLRNRLQPCVFVLTLLLLCGTLPARAQYTYTRIADTSGAFLTLSNATLNNNSTVAFVASPDPNEYEKDAYKGNGGPLTVMLDRSFLENLDYWFDYQYNGQLDIAFNDREELAFSAGWAFSNMHGQGVWVSDGHTLAPRYNLTLGYDLSLWDTIYVSQRGDINNLGGVASYGSIGQSDMDNPENSWYMSEISGVALIASWQPWEERIFTWFYDQVSINDSSYIAFKAVDMHQIDGVYVGHAGIAPRLLFSAAGPYSSFGYPVINNRNTVVVAADRNQGGRVLLMNKSAGTYLVAAPENGIPEIGNYALNDGGQVALWTRGAGNVPAIVLLSPGKPQQAVIKAGDRLDGSTVIDLAVYYDFLNNRGQVAFTAWLADGRQGVYRADPTAKPLLLR